MTTQQEQDAVALLSSEACLLYGGSCEAKIPGDELALVFSGFPEGQLSDTVAKQLFHSAKVPVGSDIDAGQLVRLCRALEQQCAVSTPSLLEAVCAAAYHRVFAAVDEVGNGFLDEVGQRTVLEAFGCTSSQIAAVRAVGVRDQIFGDEIPKIVRTAVGNQVTNKQSSMVKALQHIQQQSAQASSRRRGPGAAGAAGPTAQIVSAPSDPTCSDLVAMLDFKHNGGAHMKDVADACYAALPITSAAKVSSILNRTIELAQGALLDEPALRTFLEHHLAQHLPGMTLRAIVRALIDGCSMKFLAVAGCLSIAGAGGLMAAPGASHDTRNRPLVLTPYLEALGFSRSQITSSYQSSVSVNDALRRIFKQHASKQPGAMKAFLSHRAKVQARAGPRNNPPVPGSEEENKLFEEVFTLLDSRGTIALSLDNVMEFLEPVPSAPDPSIVEKLYDHCDVNVNGSLDRDEFRMLLHELEKAKILTFGALLQCYREFAYRKMFEIADKDGGGTIDKQELRIIMESIGCTTTEIAKVTKDMPNELSLDDFSAVIAPFSRGKSLSQIVETGNALAVASSSAKSAMKMFQNVANKASGKNIGAIAKLADVVEDAAATGAGKKSDVKKMCFGCAELDSTIATLSAQVESLKLDLSNSDYARDQQAERSASAESADSDSRGASANVNADIVDDLLRGDLYKGMRAFENIPAAAYYKKYPQLSKSFIHRIAAERVRKVTDAMQQNARAKLGEAHMFTENHKKKVEDLMEQLTVDVEMICPDIKEFFKICGDIIDRVSNPTNIDKEAVNFKLVDLNAARQKIQSMASDMDWITDKAVEWSQEATDLAVIAAPFSSRISDVLNNVLYLDQSTVALVEALCLCAFVSSSTPVDAEVWAKRVLSGTHVCIPEEAVPALKGFVDLASSRVGTLQYWEKLRHEYRRAFSLLHKALSRSTAMKKDKAVFTQGNASYHYSLRSLNNREGGPSTARSMRGGGGGAGGIGGGADGQGGGMSIDHPAYTGMGEEAVTVLTPRYRHRRPDITDPVKYVDKLLREIREHDPDLPVPEDFRRIDPGVNTFWFNEKIIDLIPNDNHCVVKVGGGYVMFEEYCRRYTISTRGAHDPFAVPGQLGIAMGGSRGGAGFGSAASVGTNTGGGTTPRSARPGTPRAGNMTDRSSPGGSPRGGGASGSATPRRVLVRQGRGVVLHY